LGEVFERLKRRGSLSEADVTAALREVRIALLEADVALPVVKDFVAAVRERAVGQEVLRSITPGQQVVKIVHDHLTETLGPEAEGLNLAAAPPAVILMVGLQGSGKTTTTAKLARMLQDKERKRALMASTDIYRPAAQLQLAQLGRQAGVATLPVVEGEAPAAIAERAIQSARREGFDVLLLDTAGRLHIDDELMAEVAAISASTRPVETLLVADAMTGQDAVNVASAFQQKVGITGIVLSRVDGDARGGAALSMKAVTGCAIKLIGVGEKLDAIEAFHPDRIAGRILGMGDMVGLVERAAEIVDKEEAERLARKMQKGGFDLEDFAQQIRQLGKMGGMEGVLKHLPGVAKVKRQLAEAKVDDRALKRQEAIILSMTPGERRRPEVIKAARKRRIAAGSGVTVQDVNRLLKQFNDMNKMMKRVSKMEKKGLLRQGLQGLMPPMR
jgi:signal recognition particle subunit SRP54